MFYKNLTEHFRDFGGIFTELDVKLDADTLLNFAIYHRQNETQSYKNTPVKAIHVHREVSLARLMQYACGSVTLASPLIFFD
jgi:hypothetical protein